MKLVKTLLLAAAIGATFTISQGAFANDEAKIQRCEAKLHTCFRVGDLNEVFTFDPVSIKDCSSICNAKYDPGNANACSLQECVSRCAVAFGVTAPPCE